MRKNLFILVCLGLGSLLQLNGQSRQKISLNSGWDFVFEDEKNKTHKQVNLPHTWNDADIIDEAVGYKRGEAWYSKNLLLGSEYRDKEISLEFEGACIKTTVYVNGKPAGVHVGGFTGFTLPITSFLIYNDSNFIQVKVENDKHFSDSIPPFSGDFSLMGGIYRDVWLIIKNKTHFAGNYGSEGIFFNTPNIDNKSATFNIKLTAVGLNKLAGGRIQYELIKQGKRIKSEITAHMSEDKINYIFIGTINNPLLWTPEDPQLYQLVLQILNANKEIIDEVQMNVGFRWFGVSTKNEFLLNGKPYKLKGASRHQDYDGIGNALTDDIHWQDIKLMKQMGCNFIRIAHYPQDPAIYDACDQLGLISWSEIPVVDKVVNSEAFHRNCELMMKEMIFQHYNHPSVAMWGYHNEVRNLDTATISNAKRLNRIAKELDAHRLTAMAFESNLDNGYFSNPLIKEIFDIPEIIGYNVYEGWYRGKIETVPAFLQTLRKLYPSKPLILSEYGAGSSTRIHTNKPTIFDFSEEYQCLFQEPYLDEGEKFPWMIGWGIWNFIDFQRDGREDVQPNINNKGMVTADRKPKDVFYLYKARWSKEPFIHIAGQNWKNRYFFSKDGETVVSVPVTIYSNQSSLKLFCNGKPVVGSPGRNSKGKFIFNVSMRQGINQLLCRSADDKLTDQLELNLQFISQKSISEMETGKQFSFNTGQTRTFYEDEKSRMTWLPDKEYRKGSWGYINGTVYNKWPGNNSWDGIREGVHKPVALTSDEPVYQTFVEGLDAWKVDVPDGKYRVVLFLCEPLTRQQRNNESRIMNIRLNSELWAENLDIEKNYGVLRALTLEKEIISKNGQGISIDFKAISGKAILNGVRIQKLN